jgi:hypothetical protein
MWRDVELRDTARPPIRPTSPTIDKPTEGSAERLLIPDNPRYASGKTAVKVMSWLSCRRWCGVAQGAHEHETKKHDLPLVRQGRT